MVHASKMKIYALPLARLGPKGTKPLVVRPSPWRRQVAGPHSSSKLAASGMSSGAMHLRG